MDSYSCGKYSIWIISESSVVEYSWDFSNVDNVVLLDLVTEKDVAITKLLLHNIFSCTNNVRMVIVSRKYYQSKSGRQLIIKERMIKQKKKNTKKR